MQVVRSGFAAVKGTRHIERESVELAEHGPVGDRLFAVADLKSGGVLKTAAHGALMAFTADYNDGTLTLTIAGRSHTGPGDGVGDTFDLDYWGRPAPSKVVPGSWNAALSDTLGLDVTLLRMQKPGACVYGNPVSIVTTGEVERIGEQLGHQVDPARFRATFVVDTPNDPRSWIGRRLRLGDAVVQVKSSMERCTVINSDPDTGIQDLKVTSALPASFTAGVDAIVIQPGHVRSGTVAHLLA